MKVCAPPHVVDFQRERAIRLWKDGKLEAARSEIIALLSERGRLVPDEELQLTINLAMFERDAGRVEEARQIMLRASPLLELSYDEGLKGKFYNTLATIYQLLGDFDQTFQEYTAASISHQRAGNLKYCADIENNIGFLLVKVDRPEDALSHLDVSEKLFLKLGESTPIAQVNDTRARAYLKKGAVDKALYFALKSVEHLMTADEPRLLLESLDTLSHVCQAKRIHDALKQSDGCITGAAHALGIAHNTSLDHLLEHKFPQFKHLRKPKSHSRRKK